jgi:hypothetical protein
MVGYLAQFAHNPVVVLYFTQAAIYAVGAALSISAGHRGLVACYAASSGIHAFLGICHIMHLA